MHVLGTPPAFILSQDQTLRKNIIFADVCSKIYYSSELTEFRLSSHSSVVKVPAVNSLSLVYLPQNFAFAPPSGVRRQKTDAFSHLLGCPAAVSTGPSSRRSLGPFSCQGIAVCPRIRLCLRGQYFTAFLVLVKGAVCFTFPLLCLALRLSSAPRSCLPLRRIV